jgi:hypothetical protein
MDIFDKILTLRDSLPTKTKKHSIVFSRRLREPIAILDLVEEGKSNRSAKQEARRYFVSAIITAFEVFWRDWFKERIDARSFTPEQLSRIKEKKFGLSEIQHILGNRITLGELITSIYSFQNSESLNRVASDLLGIDAFEKFRSYEQTIEVTLKASKGRKVVRKTHVKQKVLGRLV